MKTLQLATLIITSALLASQAQAGAGDKYFFEEIKHQQSHNVVHKSADSSYSSAVTTHDDNYLQSFLVEGGR